MGLFDRIATTASNVGASIGKTGGQVVGKAAYEVKENAKITSLRADISVLEAEIDVCYKDIGKAYIYSALSGKEVGDIGCSNILKILKPKLKRKIALEKEIAKIEKELHNSQIMQEREIVQREVDEAKAKLDKAKNIGALNDFEYNQLLSKEMKKLEFFEDIRKIKQQKELGLIDEEEMKNKIQEILG